MHSDGTPLDSNRRQVTLTRSTTPRQGTIRNVADVRLMVRDDGIVHYEFMADDDAESIKISVSRHCVSFRRCTCKHRNSNFIYMYVQQMPV